MSYVAIADRDHEEEHHDPQTFITKYVWSQDHKVIAIQYGCTAIFVGLIALALSAMMRLQLGFPDTFSFINPENYYQFITMHGMIMVIYLLTALFLGGFGNYLIPLMIGSRDMVFPYPQYAQLLGVSVVRHYSDHPVFLCRAERPALDGRCTRRRRLCRARRASIWASC